MINAIAVLTALAERGAERHPEPDDDATLLARHRAGDTEAFAELYRAHAVGVYRRLSRILGPIEEREDIVQDVFLAVHRALPRFRGDAKLRTLIHQIAINRACEHLRRQARRPAKLFDHEFFDELYSPVASPEGQTADREALVQVFACLARIKPKKRIAFLLRVIDGLSFEEIGVLVDATPETVAKRYQHGQRELDELLARTERRAS